MSEFFIDLMIIAGFEFHFDNIDTLLVYHKNVFFSGNMVIHAFPSLNRWLIQVDEINAMAPVLQKTSYICI